MSKFKEPVLELRYLLVQINLQLLCKYWPSSVNYGPMYTLARTGHNWMRAHYVLNYAQEHAYWLSTITQWGKVGIVMCRRFVFAKMKRSYCGATTSHWHRRLFDILMQCWNCCEIPWNEDGVMSYITSSWKGFWGFCDVIIHGRSYVSVVPTIPISTSFYSTLSLNFCVLDQYTDYFV